MKSRALSWGSQSVTEADRQTEALRTHQRALAEERLKALRRRIIDLETSVLAEHHTEITSDPGKVDDGSGEIP